jgi:hypothetical protein
MHAWVALTHVIRLTTRRHEHDGISRSPLPLFPDSTTTSVRLLVRPGRKNLGQSLDSREALHTHKGVSIIGGQASSSNRPISCPSFPTI